MKTSFKKAMKCFLKSVPGILYLTHKVYLSGRVLSRGGGVVRVYVVIPSGSCLFCLSRFLGLTITGQWPQSHDVKLQESYDTT